MSLTATHAPAPQFKMVNPYSVESARQFKWSSVIGHLHPERVRHLEKYICGTNILDAGCAGGGYVEHLARKNLNVVGVDRHYKLLPADGGAPRLGRYVQGDVEALPFRDKTFDCTFCFDVLEHVNDVSALRELARVTSGRLILTVPKEDDVMHGFGLTFFHYQDRTHLRNYTEASLRELVSSVPASQVKIFPELAIPMKHLVRAMVSGSDAKSLWRKVPHRLLARLLDNVPYRAVHTGLVAVVDL